MQPTMQHQAKIAKALAELEEDEDRRDATLQRVPEDLFEDRDFVLQAMPFCDICMLFEHYLPTHISADREIAYEALTTYYPCDRDYLLIFELIPTSIFADRELLLSVMSNRDCCGSKTILEFACPYLQNDFDFVSAAMDVECYAFESASGGLRGNKGLALRAVKGDGLLLADVTEDLDDDIDVVLAAVEQNGRALAHASDQMRDTREVVLKAVSNHGDALEYTFSELRADKEVVMIAVANDNADSLSHLVPQPHFALRSASEELKADIGVVLVAVQRSGMSLQYASQHLKENKEVAMLAVAKNKGAFEFVSETLKMDIDVRLACAKNCREHAMSVVEELTDVVSKDEESVEARIDRVNALVPALRLSEEDPLFVLIDALCAKMFAENSIGRKRDHEAFERECVVATEEAASVSLYDAALSAAAASAPKEVD